MAVTTPERAPEPHQPPESAPSRPGAASRALTRVRNLANTTPRRIRSLTTLVVLVVAGLLVAGTLAVGDARDGVDEIGHGAGPQVVATADLYFALSDMDAQVANVLLIGKEHQLGIGRAESLKRYDRSRTAANRAVLQATKLAGDDASARKTIGAVLDGLGRYERLASQAMLLDQQANHKAGPPSAKVIAIYRQATDLMKLELLPKAYNLTLDSGTVVRKAYQDSMAGMASGRVWVLVLGLLAAVLLVWLQIYFTVRFRRGFNPPLLVATVLTLVLALGAFAMLGAQRDHLRLAKTEGFDAVLALSQARAISNSLHADESRYLLDPGRADTYEQVYLEKSQTVFYFDSGNLGKYNSDLQNVIDKRTYLGFFGDEREHTGVTDDLSAALTNYRELQAADASMRAAVADGKRHDAIVIRMDRSTTAFADYDKSLVKLIANHQKAFDGAIADGDGGLRGWNLILPIGAAAVVLLLLVGIRPRLAEYR